MPVSHLWYGRRCRHPQTQCGRPAPLSEMEEINGEVFQNVVIFYRFAGKIERMAAAKVILVILDLNELSKKSGMNL